MKKYEITVSGSLWQTVEVEAENDKEARKLAMQEADWFEAEYSWDDCEIESVTELDGSPVEDTTPDPNQLTLDLK